MQAGEGASLKPPPRVLVIRGGAIGDFILTLPAIRLLRETIAGCHLEVLGYPGIIDLAVHAGLADATRSLEHRTMAPLFARNAAIHPVLQEYLCSFNLVISYLYDPDGHFRASLVRAGVKTLIECPHRVQPGKGHASEQLAAPLQKLAMFLEEPGWRAALFARAKPAPAAFRIALHPGSGSEKKNWPVEHWQQLGQKLMKKWPEARIMLVMGEAEEARGISSALFQPWFAHECWHNLPLTELVERLAGCTLFLGHDSGTSHLAAACGLPCLLLFGPTDPATWAPPQPAVRVVRAAGGDLARLPLEQVWTAVHESLAAKMQHGTSCDNPVTC